MTMLRRMILDNRHPEGAIPTGDSWWIQERVHYKDFNVAATTVNYDLTGWPAGVMILGGFIRAGVNWIGGAITAATLSAGTTASATAYVAAVSVFSGCPKTLPGTTIVPGTFLNAATPLTPGTVRVQLVTTTANANVLTQGWADVFLLLSGVKITA